MHSNHSPSKITILINLSLDKNLAILIILNTGGRERDQIGFFLVYTKYFFLQGEGFPLKQKPCYNPRMTHLNPVDEPTQQALFCLITKHLTRNWERRARSKNYLFFPFASLDNKFWNVRLLVYKENVLLRLWAGQTVCWSCNTLSVIYIYYFSFIHYLSFSF